MNCCVGHVIRLFFFLFLLHSAIDAQIEDQNALQKNVLSLSILGTSSYGGITYERIVSQRASLEMGIGLIGFGLGATYYPFGEIRIGKLNPFLGMKYSRYTMIHGDLRFVIYSPFGLIYVSRFGLNFAVDVGPAFFRNISYGGRDLLASVNTYPFSNWGVWGNFKIGFRF